MTTPLALAQARLDQAIAQHEAAQQMLAAAMRAINPGFDAPAAKAIVWRRWEARIEDPRSAGSPLALAYSAYRRAQNAESKARSAALRWR